jgi:nucleotide-binding universal stress UspA family protein
MIIMAVALPIEDVAASADIMFLLLFSFANISLITLRRKMPYLQRGFVVPFVPILPVVATVVNILLAVYLFRHSPVSWYIAIAWMEIGLLSYYFTRGKEEIKEIDKVEKLIGVPRRETGRNYHVLVPIANPKNTELIDFASTVARHRDGDMILLNIVRIPDNFPIQNVGYDFVKRRVETAETLSEYSTTKHNLQTRARVVVSHKIRDTILDTVNKEKANMTIIGWSGKAPRSRIMFGYNIDDIIQVASTDVGVLKGPMKGELKKILVVPGYGLHAMRSAEIASYLARDTNAQVTIVGLLTPDKTETEVRDETKQISNICRSLGVAPEEQIIRTKRPVGKLVTLSKEYDFMIIGASDKWKLLRFAFGPIQDALARKATIPLLMLRAWQKEEKMLSTSKLGDEDDEKKVGKARPARELIPVPHPIPRPVVGDEKADDEGTTEPEPDEGTAEEGGESGDGSAPQAYPAPEAVPVPVPATPDESDEAEQSGSSDKDSDKVDDWTQASLGDQVKLGKNDIKLDSPEGVETEIEEDEKEIDGEIEITESVENKGSYSEEDSAAPENESADSSIPEELQDDEIDLIQETEEVNGIQKYIDEGQSLLQNGNGSGRKLRNNIRGEKHD